MKANNLIQKNVKKYEIARSFVKNAFLNYLKMIDIKSIFNV